LEGVRRLLRSRLVDPGAPVVALTGPPGCGRTTLARQAMLDLAAGRLVLAVDEAPRRVEELLARIEETRSRQPALVVVDPADARKLADPEFDTLVAAARWSRTFKLLVTGDPGLAGQLPRAGPGQPEAVEVAVPALDHDQVGHYVRSWLAACRPASARPVHFSTDALLLLAHRAAGRPGAINALCWNMLALAASQRSMAVTSWHAWFAGSEARWTGAKPPASLRASGTWPTPEALAVLDACRAAAGLAPWPREHVG
jgi:type II secretory pathway predicted ATPase ExeA